MLLQVSELMQDPTHYQFVEQNNEEHQKKYQKYRNFVSWRTFHILFSFISLQSMYHAVSFSHQNEVKSDSADSNKD